MKRASSNAPAGLNVKKITAYLKGQAKNRNAVRITCQGGSVYIFTGYAAFKLPAVLYPEVIQPVTMQAVPADGVTIVSSDDGFVANDPHQLTAAQMFQKLSNCKEEVKRTSLLQEVEMKGKVWGTFRMFRDGSRPIMINSEYPDAFLLRWLRYPERFSRPHPQCRGRSRTEKRPGLPPLSRLLQPAHRWR